MFWHGWGPYGEKAMRLPAVSGKAWPVTRRRSCGFRYFGVAISLRGQPEQAAEVEFLSPGGKQSQPTAGFSSPLLCILSCSRAAKRRKSQGAACDARHISFMARVPDWSRCESFLGGSHRSRGAPTPDPLPVKVVPAVFGGRFCGTSVTYNRPSPGLHSPATVNCQFQPFSSR
jgi:hypothetical protein